MAPVSSRIVAYKSLVSALLLHRGDCKERRSREKRIRIDPCHQFLREKHSTETPNWVRDRRTTEDSKSNETNLHTYTYPYIHSH